MNKVIRTRKSRHTARGQCYTPRIKEGSTKGCAHTTKPPSVSRKREGEQCEDNYLQYKEIPMTKPQAEQTNNRKHRLQYTKKLLANIDGPQRIEIKNHPAIDAAAELEFELVIVIIVIVVVVFIVTVAAEVVLVVVAEVLVALVVELAAEVVLAAVLIVVNVEFVATVSTRVTVAPPTETLPNHQTPY